MTVKEQRSVKKTHVFPNYELNAEFWRNRWCESSTTTLQQYFENRALEKKLDTAVEVLKNIIYRTERDDLEEHYRERNHDIHNVALQVLVEIQETACQLSPEGSDHFLEGNETFRKMNP